jgi:protocatechuate 3,4-dioxygenase beta subunit
MSDADPVDPDLAAMLLRCAVSRPWADQDEGPYHREDQARRRDVVEDRDGVALQLGIRVARDDGAPVVDAAVEIWQCDALGRYSGFPPPDDPVVVTAATASRAEYLPDDTFLRGVQDADADGMVEFRTIYPGWYPGRTVHIHAKVHIDRQTVLTTQFYFDDAFSSKVFDAAPYASESGRDAFNDADSLYDSELELTLSDDRDGYRGLITLDVARA